jgi:transcriptional regulator with XRE-family HTH domain
MLTGEQIRAARGLLGWGQADLAAKSGIGLTTIRRLEARDGIVSGTVGTAMRIQRALEEGGVLFLGEDGELGAGVRLAKPRQLSLL